MFENIGEIEKKWEKACRKNSYMNLLTISLPITIGFIGVILAIIYTAN